MSKETLSPCCLVQLCSVSMIRSHLSISCILWQLSFCSVVVLVSQLTEWNRRKQDDAFKSLFHKLMHWELRLINSNSIQCKDLTLKFDFVSFSRDHPL